MGTDLASARTLGTSRSFGRPGAFHVRCIHRTKKKETYCDGCKTGRHLRPLREDPDFDKLDSGVQEILPHLLDPNPRTRWTADEAIQRVEEVASQRGIAVPPQRRQTLC